MHWGKVVGCIFLVAGTTIGAGMLAIPLALSGLGFPIAIILLCAVCLLMAYTALLTVEANLAYGVGLSFHSLAKKSLGRRGVLVTNISLLFLFYALIAAYTSGGASLLSNHLQEFNIHISQPLAAFIFLTFFGGLITLGIEKVDIANRGLFICKIFILFLVLTLLMPMVQKKNLLTMPVEASLLISSLPIVFTSFGFHGSIPSIVQYVGAKKTTLKIVFLAGSALPLVIYILWLLGIQGSLPQGQLLALSNDIDALPKLFAAIGGDTEKNFLMRVLAFFSDLALTTSFLGVGIGLFDLLKDSCKRKNTLSGRMQTMLLTFIPPLLLTLFYPQGFIKALGYASIALAVLAVLLPVCMVYQVRRQKINQLYQVSGGSAALWLCAGAGILIIIAQCVVAFGLVG